MMLDAPLAPEADAGDRPGRAQQARLALARAN